MLLKSIAHALSPAGASARLSILIFHRVLSQPDPLFPNETDMRRFDEVLGWLRQWFNVLPLDQALAQLRNETLPARAAVITFDDGYADNASNALPVLRHHGVSATFFISTAFLDGGCMWNDAIIESVRHCQGRVLDLRELGLGVYSMASLRHRSYAISELIVQIKYLNTHQRHQAVTGITALAGARAPKALMMRPEQVLQLRNAGMQVGAHTCSHPILESVSDGQSRWEITTCKLVLESLLREPVQFFAYPNGKPGVDYSARHMAMVKEAGFAAALATMPGVASPASDFYQLPRFTPWDRTRTRYGLRMLTNLWAGDPHAPY